MKNYLTLASMTDDFREVLERYDHCGGLFLNWLEFGHSNQLHRPKNICIETFTKRAPANSWWHASGKSIVKPKELLRPYAPGSDVDKLGYSFLSPHLFKTDKPTVHTDFTPVSYRHWWRSEHICHDVAVCNHYRYRSQEDWRVKCHRGNVCDACKDNVNEVGYSLDEWLHGGNWSIEDMAILRFAKRVREVLGTE